MQDNAQQNLITDLDKLIHEPARLMIVIYLFVVESADFTYLIRQTGLTWGNLSAHISKLEAAGYIEVSKGFVNKKPNTMLSLTKQGRQAFKKYRSNMKQVFDDLNCGFCHNGVYYTDGKIHEIGIPGASDRTNKWDTPTLIETWRTAPYLHDGRSATLNEVFINEKHGIRTDIGSDKIEQLVEYVLSL